MAQPGETKLYIKGVDSVNFLNPKGGFISTEPLPPDKAAEVLETVDVSGVLFIRRDQAGCRFHDGVEDFEVVFPDRTRLDYHAIIQAVEEHIGTGYTIVLS